jgi:hypothetical protein
MDLATLKEQSKSLKDLSVNADLNKFLESQGSVQETYKKINEMNAATDVLNKEFDERYLMTGGTYKLPLLGTNQDLILYGFFFSYTFLTLVVLITIYKNTNSFRNTLYALLMSAFLLLIITGLLFRVG